MMCIVCSFRKTKGKDGIGLQRIIAYCGSRYLAFSLQAPCVESAEEKEKELAYYSHFRKHMKKIP
jgi:hypothetical protein